MGGDVAVTYSVRNVNVYTAKRGKVSVSIDRCWGRQTFAEAELDQRPRPVARETKPLQRLGASVSHADPSDPVVQAALTSTSTIACETLHVACHQTTLTLPKTLTSSKYHVGHSRGSIDPGEPMSYARFNRWRGAWTPARLTASRRAWHQRGTKEGRR